MNAVARRLAAACLLLAGSFSAARAAGPAATGLDRPDAFAFTVAPSGDAAVAVLESDLGRVKLGALGGSGRVESWRELEPIARPVFLASDETGLLLAVERSEGAWRLAKFRRGSPDGPAVRLEMPKGASGEPAGAAARSGILWIVLRKPSAVLFFAYDGALLGRASGESELKSPFSVAVGPAGEAYVTDPMGPGVAVFTASGTLDARVDLGGSGVTRPAGVAVDGGGRVWLSDAVTGRVVCLEKKGDGYNVGCRNEARFEDPLRLGFGPPGLWVLEGRGGRLVPMEEARR